jgi:hypothetical protein
MTTIEQKRSNYQTALRALVRKANAASNNGKQLERFDLAMQAGGAEYRGTACTCDNDEQGLFGHRDECGWVLMGAAAEAAEEGR